MIGFLYQRSRLAGIAYNDANRLIESEEVEYTWDDNGNLLDDGINTYTYDSANRLISFTNGVDAYTFTYNGFGDRLQQTVNSDTTNYTLDLASELPQVLYDGDNFYTYGIGRISQLELYGNTPEYFITDALGSVRQLTHESRAVLMTQSYDPYGNVMSSNGSVDSIYGYTGEQTDATGNIYLRARYYNPTDGRFLSRDTWGGEANRPLSMNRWNYVEGNPINYTDPSGHYRVGTSGALLGLGQLQSPFFSSTVGMNILTFIIDCTTSTHTQSQNQSQKQYDLTGYLALAMTKHGQDARVKEISNLITWHIPAAVISPIISSGMLTSAYLKFYNLEASKKEWDIKVRIGDKDEGLLGQAIILCGDGIQSCDWYDYSTVGNIHFGYIAGLAKINYFISGVAGGVLEQRDLKRLTGKFNFGHCGWTSGIPLFCDNPNDQYAVDFGFELAKKYPNGISEKQLEVEITGYWHGNLFQKPPLGSIPRNVPLLPQINHYGPDYFNYDGG